ncbi:MAG: S8 family serine peptidase [bacterium]|nr:S8 family serine peptidase [bacterium]
MRSLILPWGFGGEILPSNLPVVSGDLGFSIRPSGLGFDRAHEGATGQGVVVAVLDGGFNVDHPFLAGNVLPGYDVIGRDTDVNDAGNGYDDDGDGIVDGALGHGTFVAGMVLMSAPDALIVPIRVADDEGRSTTSELATGIDYALAMGANVINISVETIVQNESLTKYLTYAAQSGVLIIVSAGNGGTDQLRFIAADPATIAVGATDGSDCLSAFSNLGPCVSTYAPGVDLYGPFGGLETDSWAQWSGTSFSAGFVSGAAALAKQLDPGITKSEFDRTLRESGRNMLATDGSLVLEGYARLHLADLVEKLKQLIDD